MVKKLDLYMESGIRGVLDYRPETESGTGCSTSRDYDLAEDAHFGAGERAESSRYPGLSGGVDGLLE
ncbi:MAG: hypothetical protein U5P10_17830 [Spirochaetia bacterium]|nr:hypothetical protein [Spirochaetia bacterium]